MELTTFWFVIIAILWIGYFVLEGFDFGVGVILKTVAKTQAEKAGHTTDHEIKILAAHGFLHLLGFDHQELEDEKEMFALQEELVKRYNI